MLSKREIMILELVAEGKSAKQIAPLVGINHRTVQNLLTGIYKVMGVRNCKEAIATFSKNHEKLEQSASEFQINLAWYIWKFADGQWAQACTQWVQNQLEEARFVVCLMMALSGNPETAKQESLKLRNQEASFFFLFKQWLDGDQKALALMEKLTDGEMKKFYDCCTIAIYHGALQIGDMSAVGKAGINLYTLCFTELKKHHDQLLENYQ